MKYLRAALVPLALIIVGLVRALKHVGIRIRFGVMLSTRIGHLVGNMDTYLAERAEGRHKALDLWTHYGKPCNETIVRLLRQRIFIDPTGFVLLLIKVNKLFEGWAEHEIPCADVDRDPYGLRAKHGPQLKLTHKDIERGRATMRDWGLNPARPWVCFMVRDAAYLPTLAYHSYRDCDVEDFGPAMLELANRGYYVFRMGAKVAKPLTIEHRNVFDYATNGMRSDFMDVFLGALCDFYVSTSTGWDAIPQAFRRPGCYANFVPLEYMPTWMPNSIAIWKHHLKDGRRMTLAEIHKSGAGQFMRSDEFASAGITLQDNTPQEVKEVVLEMAHLRIGITPTPSDEALQREFWKTYPVGRSTFSDAPLHGTINLRIGSKFLRHYLEPQCSTASAS